ncbi:unnamed protein product [Durusdinium trenchii]|uniref:Uncharacterized protein n=1 Tax=Durusdinium trenchii TaxID=1381693 RepID=A0ABP0NNL8_9DINO
MGDAKTIGPKEEGAEPRQGLAGPVEALEEPVPAAGEDLPPPEEEAPEEVAPVETNEVEQQTEAPDEQTEAPDELSGPPLMLVNSEGQNLLAKEKTRQLINKVNLLSKSLQAVCEAKRDEEHDQRVFALSREHSDESAENCSKEGRWSSLRSSGSSSKRPNFHSFMGEQCQSIIRSQPLQNESRTSAGSTVPSVPSSTTNERRRHGALAAGRVADRGVTPKKDGLLIDGWDLVTDSATINQKTPETSWAMIRHQGPGPGVPNRGMRDAHVTTLGMQNRGEEEGLEAYLNRLEAQPSELCTPVEEKRMDHELRSPGS